MGAAVVARKKDQVLSKRTQKPVKAKGEKTRERILDAAEELFGEGNYDSISLRDVAHKAHVLLGVVTYHFNVKEALFEAVATRRAEELNSIRLAELRGYKQPSAEQIVDAFIRPVLSRTRQPRWRNYTRIIAHIAQEERWAHINNRLFRATAREFYEALLRSVPGASHEWLTRGFLYVIFVMLGVSHHNAKLTALTRAYSATDFKKVYPSVLAFVVGGIRALAAKRTTRLPMESERRLPAARPVTSRRRRALPKKSRQA